MIFASDSESDCGSCGDSAVGRRFIWQSTPVSARIQKRRNLNGSRWGAIVVSHLAATDLAVKPELPEVDPHSTGEIGFLAAVANNFSRCEGHFRALSVYRQVDCCCLISE